MFVCAFRAQKVKAFVSSCGTTRLSGEKTFKSSDGNLVTIKYPEIVDEYKRHKSSSVDAANNLRDNLTSYHDIISTGRRTLSLFRITNKLESCWELSDLGLVSESIDCREREEKNKVGDCDSGCSVKTETNKVQKETNPPSTMFISSCRD
ncbi:hypothetical protein CU097_014213 [Rhizopus azygosporus]|uniref:Uncharacterized protein n=1 Tax=Rhizopus azygosporus TaxID=86630 RepID=A0A367KCS8_RHIAZ|nr:hypothetical protein CU097_014213 [Rhizopus azygosporus]